MSKNFDAWAAKRYPHASRKDSLGGFSRDMRKSALEGWEAATALDAVTIAQQAARIAELEEELALSNECLDMANETSEKRGRRIAEKVYRIAELEEQRGGVVLPERIKRPATRTLEAFGYVNGWNACLDEVACLNQPGECVAVRRELLDRIVSVYEGSIIDAAYWTDANEEMHQLRALLAQQGKPSCKSCGDFGSDCDVCGVQQGKANCACVYATSRNTASVRKGYEPGGYLKHKCAACAQAAPEAEPVAWVPSAALAKLRNGSNNAPCVLTDGPAEFNDTAVYLAPQHDAELIELLNLAADTLDDVCHGSMLEQTIRTKLATLRHV